eukprot:Blabericola_migrator_1__3171@NODE_1927_length_3552_cov_17_319369_g1233_i0_p3_GENE_NODE_1927_length_3552_cov_17_319369_g1233_i0NODE_1927_length_3552_cov_17_319369_g1233_i0_p3_ORF_typecomplete_len122_score11_96_NODE_1927_length_3552_cov_17_319369_g1233_i011581523
MMSTLSNRQTPKALRDAHRLLSCMPDFTTTCQPRIMSEINLGPSSTSIHLECPGLNNGEFHPEGLQLPLVMSFKKYSLIQIQQKEYSKRSRLWRISPDYQHNNISYLAELEASVPLQPEGF